MATATDGRLVYTVEEAATLLRISRTLAYDAAASGELPTVRVGRRLLVQKAALLKKLEAGQGQEAE